MTKKKPAIKVSVEPAEQIDPTPPEELPSRQVDVVPVEEQTEPEPLQEAEPEKSAQVEPTLVETPAGNEPPSVPVLGPKPKSLNMAYLQEEIDYLTYQIGELLKYPVRQRKPPASNGKIMIKDTLTGKIYPSKNNVYQSLLKSGDLKDLVDKGVFGANPEKNSFGCYALFRAYPNRFEEVRDQEQSV